MTADAGFNPFIGREQDVLSMCEHFLEDDRIKDNPTKYHKKLAILTISVVLLKHLYGDDLTFDNLLNFISSREVMERELLSSELRGTKTDRGAVEWFRRHLAGENNEYKEIIMELADELRTLPH